MAAERGLRHEAEPDFVGDQHDGARRIAERPLQRREFLVDRGLGHQQIRQPQGQAIDQQRTLGIGLGGDCVRDGERRLDRMPERTAPATIPSAAIPPGAMRGDPRPHLIVLRLGGRAIGAAARRPFDEGFGKAALARARPAQDQRQWRQLPPIG